MTVHVIALVTLVLATACTSLRHDTQVAPVESINLDLKVEVTSDAHPIAEIVVKNVNSSAIAFSDSFGITNDPWLSLEIRGSGGPVYYPVEIDAFGTAPTYRCIAPGEQLERKIDLLDWHPNFGDRISSESYAFDLSPGRYEVRVRYSDDPLRIKARCPGIRGTATSDWVAFEIPPTDSSPD